MLSFPGLRSSIGLVIATAALSVTAGDAQAQYYQSTCRSTYSAMRYQPRYYDPSVVYLDEPVVYVERIRPRRHVRYRYYSPRPHRYYRRGTGLGHVIRHLFHGDRGHHRSRHGYGGRRGHGHRGGHYRHSRH